MNSESLKKEIKDAEASLENPNFKDNAQMLKSLKTKISILKTQIRLAEKAEGKIAKPEDTSKEAGYKAPKQKPVSDKKDITKKDVKEKSAKEKKPKSSKDKLDTNGLKVGDKVEFYAKADGKNKTGTIKSFRPDSVNEDKILAKVECKDKSHNVDVKKCTKK